MHITVRSSMRKKKSKFSLFHHDRSNPLSNENESNRVQRKWIQPNWTENKIIWILVSTLRMFDIVVSPETLKTIAHTKCHAMNELFIEQTHMLAQTSISHGVRVHCKFFCRFVSFHWFVRVKRSVCLWNPISSFHYFFIWTLLPLLIVVFRHFIMFGHMQWRRQSELKMIKISFSVTAFYHPQSSIFPIAISIANNE